MIFRGFSQVTEINIFVAPEVTIGVEDVPFIREREFNLIGRASIETVSDRVVAILRCGAFPFRCYQLQFR